MGKKYIIELNDECNSEFKGILAFGLTQEKQISVELIPEESLTPYTEPDMEKIRKRGYDKGLDDIGNALRLLLFQYSNYTLQEIFGYDTARAVVKHFEGSEIVARIRCYEGGVKQDVETIRKEAYQKGYKDATVKIGSDEQPIADKAYQSGLSDAWEAARKICAMDSRSRDEIFGAVITTNILDHNSASKALEEIRAHEQAQKEKEEEIQVGDEVVGTYTGEEETEPFVIIRKIPEIYPNYYFGIYSKSGEFCQGGLKLKKTGRHFPEIAEVLRKMGED